ncbi:MAG: MAPEG family protein [Pseudomonadota bacterium]
MTLTFTPLFAAVLAIVFMRLSMAVIGARQRAKVAVGDGGDEALRRAIRVHANFIEYTPLCLLLLALAELNGVHAALICVAGALLLIGRLTHAHGMGQTPEPIHLRRRGMQMTIFALIGSVALSVWGVVRHLVGTPFGI